MAAHSCRSRLFDTSEIISCAVIFPVLALVGEAPSRGQQSLCNSSLRIKRIMGALRHRRFILRERFQGCHFYKTFSSMRTFICWDMTYQLTNIVISPAVTVFGSIKFRSQETTRTANRSADLSLSPDRSLVSLQVSAFGSTVPCFNHIWNSRISNFMKIPPAVPHCLFVTAKLVHSFWELFAAVAPKEAKMTIPVKEGSEMDVKSGNATKKSIRRMRIWRVDFLFPFSYVPCCGCIPLGAECRLRFPLRTRTRKLRN